MEPVPFEVDAFVAALPRGIDVGSPVSGPWSIAHVYRGSDEGIHLLLRSDGGGAFEVVVRKRDDSRPAFHRSPRLDVLHLSPQSTDPVTKDVQALDAMRRLASAIAWADREGREWIFPEPTAVLPDEDPGWAKDRSLNLAIDAACGSSCGFCSLLDVREPVRRFDDGYHAWIEQELVRGRAQARRLRVNGIEPLRYPRIVEVLERARDLGYDSVRIFTTAQPLSERDFAEKVVAALPAERLIDVPLYGATAEAHDPLTAVPGSFARVTRALDNLLSLLEPEEVQLTTVVMKQNLDQMADLAAMAARRGILFKPQLPYPSVGHAEDRFFEVAPRMTDAVEVLHGLEPPLPLLDAPPCIARRGPNAARVEAMVPAEAPLRGRAYRDPRYLHSGGQGPSHLPPAVPCPHVSGCAIADRCPRELYRAYVDLYGTSELEPVVP